MDESFQAANEAEMAFRNMWLGHVTPHASERPES
jgi:hypothetical protein